MTGRAAVGVTFRGRPTAEGGGEINKLACLLKWIGRFPRHIHGKLCFLCLLKV